MRQLGDYNEDAQYVDFKFPTTQADGTPITLAGSPAVSVYKKNDTTQSTAGVTLTVDFDSVTGMHHVRIDLNADAFYETGADYDVVITAGTVDGVSVVGRVIAGFSIAHRVMRGTDNAALASVLGTPTGADIATDIANVDAAIAALNDISASDVWAEIIEIGFDAGDIMRLMSAALAGKLTIVDNGNNTFTFTFTDITNSKARITAIVDTSGQRTSVTTDAT